MSALKTLHALIGLLEQEGTSAADVADNLGGESSPGGANRAMVIEPRAESITRAEVFPGAASDTPAHVTLTLGAGLTLEELGAEFGESTFVPIMKPGDMQRRSFHVRHDGAAYTIALFASHEDGAVRRVLLRRDKV